MAVGSTPRKFTVGHFAFMRAVVQGIDLRAIWDRYLRTEVEDQDLRKGRSTIARMRTELAAAARRHARPGTARLIHWRRKRSRKRPGCRAWRPLRPSGVSKTSRKPSSRQPSSKPTVLAPTLNASPAARA